MSQSENRPLLRHLRRLAKYRFDILPRRLVYGGRILKHYDALLASQWEPLDRIRQTQLIRLQRLVKHAYDNSPFYHRRFRETGLEPGDIKSFSDYARIPYLTKADLRDNLEEMKVRDFESYRPILTRTGGTTGAPLMLYRSRNTAEMRQAVEWRNYKMGGFDYRDRKMTLFPGTHDDVKKGPYFEDPKYKAMVVKSFEADDARMQLFRDLFHRYQPKFLVGIPQFYRVLGRYLEQRGLDDMKVDALFIQGEAMLDEDRENFRRWFGATTYDFYGMRENAVSASECSEGTMHINSEFTYIEFEIDHRPTVPGELGNIIGTSLHNYAVPLIRYVTGDMGTHEENGCPCGRELPVMKIIGGRTRDYLTTRSKLIFICHHIVYLLELSNGYEELQFFQPDIDHVVIRLVANRNYNPQDAELLVREVELLTGGELEVSVELVDQIPRTRVGKYRFVVSEIEAVV